VVSQTVIWFSAFNLLIHIVYAYCVTVYLTYHTILKNKNNKMPEVHIIGRVIGVTGIKDGKNVRGGWRVEPQEHTYKPVVDDTKDVANAPASQSLATSTDTGADRPRQSSSSSQLWRLLDGQNQGELCTVAREDEAECAEWNQSFDMLFACSSLRNWPMFMIEVSSVDELDRVDLGKLKLGRGGAGRR
jgi:Ciliary basal body-associated, B9 protein